MDGTLDDWQGILTHYYPVRPKPVLTLDGIYRMLPVLHKYHIKSLLEDCLEHLKASFPANLSPKPDSQLYIIKWLKLADDLQLDGLKAACLTKAKELTENNKFGVAALEYDPSLRQPSNSFIIQPPQVNQHIKGLSRGVLEELLAGVVAAYITCERKQDSSGFGPGTHYMPVWAGRN